MAVSGPAASSRQRWMAMRSEVSGVRNSWATVATTSFLSSSKRCSRVTSWRITVAPRNWSDSACTESRAGAGSAGHRGLPPACRVLETRWAGRRPCPSGPGCGSSPWRAHRGLGPGQRLQVDRDPGPRAAARSAAWFTERTSPATPKMITASGRLSMAAWADAWACRSSPSELARYCCRCWAMRLNFAGPGTRPRPGRRPPGAGVEVSLADALGGLAQHRERPQEAGGDRVPRRARQSTSASSVTARSSEGVRLLRTELWAVVGSCAPWRPGSAPAPGPRRS